MPICHIYLYISLSCHRKTTKFVILLKWKKVTTLIECIIVDIFYFNIFFVIKIKHLSDYLQDFCPVDSESIHGFTVDYDQCVNCEFSWILFVDFRLTLFVFVPFHTHNSFPHTQFLSTHTQTQENKQNSLRLQLRIFHPP